MTLTLEDKISLQIAAGQGQATTISTDPALEALLAKPHDRLLIDAGLSRRSAMGLDRYLWAEWQRSRNLWAL